MNSTPTKIPDVTPPAGVSAFTPITRAELWRRRLKLGIEVVFFIELGMLLVVLPWTALWADNNLLIMRPALRTFMTQGFVRGALTGLGLVNIWIGVWEAIQYSEKPR